MTDVRLFSYGTLQQEAVQIANFGRLLRGAADVVTGYRLACVRIDDPEVVTESGSDVHPILVATGNAGDLVNGKVFLITAAELAAADDYETDAYVRIEVTLGSGDRAWAYAQPSPTGTRSA